MLDGIIVVASLVDLALQYSGETVRLYMIGSGRGGVCGRGGGSWGDAAFECWMVSLLLPTWWTLCCRTWVRLFSHGGMGPWRGGGGFGRGPGAKVLE